jgi:hypothetical protein
MLFSIPFLILIAHTERMVEQPSDICGTFVEPFCTRMVGKSLDAIIGPVGLLDVDPMRVESPRSEQLNALRRHLDYEFVGQVACCEARVVVYSENVHGGLEQVSLV